MMKAIRATLAGADAELGRVAAADIAHIILGLQRAIARAAYVVLDKPRRKTGRHSQAIENAARLRFLGIEAGSVVSVLALPDADDELPVPVPHLSALAVGHLLDVVNAAVPDPDAELAAAVAQMATELGIGDRNSSVTISDGSDPTAEAPFRRATIDLAVRERMQRLSAGVAPLRDEVLVGVLFAADFEERSAQLRLPDGNAVTIRFPPGLEDQVHEALRSPARVEGVVRYHPRTSLAVSVELRTLGTSRQMLLDPDSFWRSHTFADLQEIQGVTGRVSPAELTISDLTDDERVAFLEGLAA